MLALRRLQSGETDPELLWLAVGAGAAILAGAWMFHGPPDCAFHALTGLPCLTCGGTRCLRSLFAGEVSNAFAWNPLVFTATVGAFVFALYAVAVTSLQLPRLRLTTPSTRAMRAIRVAVAATLAANWIYLLLRFSPGA